MKALGVAAKDVGDDALKALSKVESPEIAVALKGKPRQQYLNALDDVYGPQAKRIEDSQRTLKSFHGSPEKNIDQFIPSQGGSQGGGVYTTPSKQIAQGYAHEGKVYSLLGPENLADFSNRENAEKVAQKLGIEMKPLPAYKKFSDSHYYDLLTDYIAKVDPEYKLKGTERENALNKALEQAGFSGSKFKRNDEEILNYFKPESLRSEKAAFDPRFAKSGLLMAGAGAIPQTDISPIPLLKKAFNTYEEAKNKIVEPLAKQLNFSKNPEDTDTYKNVLSMGLDPLNFVSGPIGAGLSAIQLGTALTPDNEKEMKLKALKKMAGE